jgi:hypothetical protein
MAPRVPPGMNVIVLRRVGLPARSAIIDVLRECLIHFLNGEQRCRLGSHEARGRDG